MGRKLRVMGEVVEECVEFRTTAEVAELIAFLEDEVNEKAYYEMKRGGRFSPGVYVVVSSGEEVARGNSRLELLEKALRCASMGQRYTIFHVDYENEAFEI